MNRYEKTKAQELTDILCAIALRVTHMDKGSCTNKPHENVQAMKDIIKQFPIIKKLGLGKNEICPSCVSLEVIYKLAQLLGIEE